MFLSASWPSEIAEAVQGMGLALKKGQVLVSEEHEPFVRELLQAQVDTPGLSKREQYRRN